MIYRDPDKSQAHSAQLPNWRVGLLLFVLVAGVVLTVSWFTTLREFYEIALDPGLASGTVVDVHHESTGSFDYVYSVDRSTCSGRGYRYAGQSVTVGQSIPVQYARHSPCISTDHPHEDPWAYFRDYTRNAVVVSVVFAAIVGLLAARTGE